MIVQPSSLHMRSAEQAGELVGELLVAIAGVLGQFWEAAISSLTGSFVHEMGDCLFISSTDGEGIKNKK